MLGVGTNIAFLRGLLADGDVRAGRLDTELVDRRLSTLVSSDVPAEFFVAAALDRLLELQPSGSIVDPWAVPDGWRLSGSGGVTFRLKSGSARAVVRVQGTPADATVWVGEDEPVRVSAQRAGDVLEIRHAAGFHRYRHAEASDGARYEGKKLLPDVDERCEEVAGYITPRLGGVGPTTIAMLFRNAVECAERRAGLA